MGADRFERGVLVLGRAVLGGASVHLGRTCLVHAGIGSDSAKRLQDVERTELVSHSGEYRHLERPGHVALGGEAVNLVWLMLLKYAQQAECIGDVAVLQYQPSAVASREQRPT